MTQRNVTAFVVGVAFFLFFGGFAVFLGQDASWDTLNYHVYNPYAFLNDRLNIDLAPAQLQSYFSPVIDLPVYWLTQHLRPWLAGFWVGGVQGLNALLVFLISRQLLATTKARPFWTPLLLASLSCLNASFVSQLGTSAGDSSTSPFVLLALYLVCRWHDELGAGVTSSRAWAIWIGLLMGVAVGLKLTNAPFGIAMVLVLAVMPLNTADTLRQVVLYGLGAIASFALTSGWWFYKVWTKFGNPLFPQFNGFFKSDLAAATTVIDTRWGPVNAVEALAWPFWMSLRPWRIHDAPLYNHLWLATYIVLGAWLAGYLFRRWHGRDPAASSAWIVMVFVGASYVIWLKVFSIGRYMTAVEVLLPLLLFLGLRAITWPRVALSLTLTLTFVSLILGLKHSNFGIRAAWAEESYLVTVPPIQNPSSATILIAAGGMPNSWLLPHFPSQVAVLRVSGNFPRSDAYDNLVRQTVASRGGSIYAIIPTTINWTAVRAEQLNQQLAESSLVHQPATCHLIGQVTRAMNRYRHISIEMTPGGNCTAIVKGGVAASPMNEIDQLNKSNKELIAVGFRLEAETCHHYTALVGAMRMPYKLCDVKEIQS